MAPSSSSRSLLVFLFAAAAGACAVMAQNVTWGTEDNRIMEQLRTSVTWSGVQLDPLNASSSPCNWTTDLVTCNDEGRVYQITLGSSDVSGGTVPPTNQNDLPNLNYFDVPHCNLEGVIPNFTGSPRLHSLVVTENRFSSIAPGLFDSKAELQFVEMDNNDQLAPWELPEGLMTNLLQR
ncbi:unnamed protein product [Cuscuta europaea]|uniref:Leucine-rich repeat-containing N-terminal plant-type domain-containing protein n=1 Tax=Cuscuta europaea TaxID=41803 RepID=A0A9P1EH90_CUSEU|nr:unnamed protein product [Cuscuta europaea]